MYRTLYGQQDLSGHNRDSNLGPPSPKRVAIPTVLPGTHNLHIQVHMHDFSPLFLQWGVSNFKIEVRGQGQSTANKVAI